MCFPFWLRYSFSNEFIHIMDSTQYYWVQWARYRCHKI